MKGLTHKEEKFVQGLIKGQSQRTSYKEAYPNTKGWKDKSIDERASRLFGKDKVKSRFNELNDKILDEIAQEGVISAKYVLQEIKDMLETDITDIAEIITVEKIERDEEGNILYNSEGEPLTDFHQVMKMKDTNEMSKAALKSISEIGHNKFGIYIKRYDKQKTIDQAGKHLKLFTDRVELEVTKMPEIKLGK